MELVSIACYAVAVVLGIVVHESAHALAAYLLGDKTARQQGRVSFNPLAHVDPFGTIVLPLIMIVLGGPVFAFAKPVPVNLGNLRHPKRDEVLVALAGPVSNILLACLGAGALALVLGTVPLSADTIELLMNVSYLAQTVMLVNLSLAFFNLIPLPPLDGSSILVPFLRGEALRTYWRIQAYAMPILLCVLYLLPMVLRIDLVGLYFDVTVYPLFDVLSNLALAAL